MHYKNFFNGPVLYLGLKLTIYVIKSQIHLVRQSLQVWNMFRGRLIWDALWRGAGGRSSANTSRSWAGGRTAAHPGLLRTSIFFNSGILLHHRICLSGLVWSSLCSTLSCSVGARMRLLGSALQVYSESCFIFFLSQSCLLQATKLLFSFVYYLTYALTCHLTVLFLFHVCDELFLLCLEYLTGGFFDFFFFLCTAFNTASSAALRFHCVGGCWDRTQDCCYFGYARS